MKTNKMCNNCGKSNTSKFKSVCATCYQQLRHRSSSDRFICNAYSALVARCKTKNGTCSEIYYGLEFCSREDFYNKYRSDQMFLGLYKAWQDSNFNRSLVPSVDRIDKMKGYLIDNMQWLTITENIIKDQGSEVAAFHIQNLEDFRIFESVNEACRELNLQDSNAWKVIGGTRRSTGGYKLELL